MSAPHVLIEMPRRMNEIIGYDTMDLHFFSSIATPGESTESQAGVARPAERTRTPPPHEV